MRPGRAADHFTPFLCRGHGRVELYLYPPSGPHRACNGITLLFYSYYYRGDMKFTAQNVPIQIPPVLLIKADWRLGTACRIAEGRVMREVGGWQQQREAVEHSSRI